MRTLFVKRPPWMRHGACVDSHPDLFFPDEKSTAAYDDARAVCAVCVVRVACLEYALARHERFGMWGGTTPRERLRLARQRARDRRCAS